jgi:transposase
MPRINYPVVIKESVADLTRLERQLRGQPTAARVRLLRLLKSGQTTTLAATAPLLGYGERSCARWWAAYRTGGLDALLDYHTAPGRVSRLSEEAWQGLETAMTAGEIATLKDTQRYLAETWDIHYQSLTGIWEQIRTRRARKKTGRRRHRQADRAAQDAYKR